MSDLKDVISQLSEISDDETGYSHQFQVGGVTVDNNTIMIIMFQIIVN